MILVEAKNKLAMFVSLDVRLASYQKPAARLRPTRGGKRKEALRSACHAGTGKSAVMRNVLAGMEGDNIISTTINLNSFSDAPALQPILENPLEKKSGAASESRPIPMPACQAYLCAQLCKRCPC